MIAFEKGRPAGAGACADTMALANKHPGIGNKASLEIMAAHIRGWTKANLTA